MELCSKVIYGPGILLVPLYILTEIFQIQVRVSSYCLSSWVALWNWSNLCAPEQVWWFLHCKVTVVPPYILSWSWLGLIVRNVWPVYSSSSAWCGILSPGVSLLHWKHHYILSVHTLSWWVICVSSHLWVLCYQAAGPLNVADFGPSHTLPPAWCLHPYCLQVCMHLWLLCQPQWVSLWKVHVPYHPCCLSTKNQVSSGICDLEHSFPQCQTYS